MLKISTVNIDIFALLNVRASSHGSHFMRDQIFMQLSISSLCAFFIHIIFCRI